MSFLNIAKSRYTTKKYNPNEKIDNETIEKLKEIIRLSPSSINSQPWKFTFVSDEEVKSKLADASYNNKLALLPEGATLYYNRMLKPRGDEQIKTWLISQVYLSLGFFLSATASLGIDSTPMEGIQVESYDDILQDDDYKTLFAVAIGYRDNEDINQPVHTPKFRLEQNQIIRSI